MRGSCGSSRWSARSRASSRLEFVAAVPAVGVVLDVEARRPEESARLRGQGQVLMCPASPLPGGNRPHQPWHPVSEGIHVVLGLGTVELGRDRAFHLPVEGVVGVERQDPVGLLAGPGQRDVARGAVTAPRVVEHLTVHAGEDLCGDLGSGVGAPGVHDGPVVKLAVQRSGQARQRVRLVLHDHGQAHGGASAGWSHPGPPPGGTLEARAGSSWSADGICALPAACCPRDSRANPRFRWAAAILGWSWTTSW